ncbi:uncharacterized protein LOC135393437 [Ornithodoros turicata]|uniref:uncharacterized protein LOC135393437 n=1 Tax=Ornithodoros turicata TaxID=34597 RepID=UPI003139A352
MLELEEESSTLTRRLQKYKRKIERLRNLEQAPTVGAPRVDIGLGVVMDAGVLHRVEAGARGDGTKLARSLLRAVFHPDELVGNTLLGGKCNAHKAKPAKPALDQTLANAVIGYACKKTGTDPVRVKASLATMLAKMK